MELKPIAHRVDMYEGTEFGPHWLLLGPDKFYGNGFTHEALYSGKQAAEMYAEIERLRAALDSAQGGLLLAYDAASKHLNDEVLLHCGHHEAQIANVLDTPNV
jgi:hypothetical protein